MEKFKASIVNPILKALIVKVDSNVELSVLDIRVLRALIDEQLSKWCALESYWNIPINALREGYIEDSLTNEGLLDLYTRLLTLKKDPHIFRWIKPILQSLVKDHLVKNLALDKSVIYDVITPDQKKIPKEDRLFEIKYDLPNDSLTFIDYEVGEDQQPAQYRMKVYISKIYS